MGVRQLPSQGERLLTPLEGLIRIAMQPQGMGRIGEANYPGVLPVEEGVRAMSLGVVEDNPLLDVCLGKSDLS
jgi:hypothetical protein